MSADYMGNWSGDQYITDTQNYPMFSDVNVNDASLAYLYQPTQMNVNAPSLDQKPCLCWKCAPRKLERMAPASKKQIPYTEKMQVGSVDSTIDINNFAYIDISTILIFVLFVFIIYLFKTVTDMRWELELIRAVLDLRSMKST